MLNYVQKIFVNKFEKEKSFLVFWISLFLVVGSSRGVPL